jgi:hypothetical protein
MQIKTGPVLIVGPENRHVLLNPLRVRFLMTFPSHNRKIGKGPDIRRPTNYKMYGEGMIVFRVSVLLHRFFEEG